MRAVVLMIPVLMVAGMAHAQQSVSERQLQVELQRNDQVMGRLGEQNERLLGQVRSLERDNLMLKKALEAQNARVEQLSDRLQQVENVNVRNVEAAQKQINQRINAQENNLYDWGGKTRDCPDIGVKHQQIKVVTKPDGGRTVRFLCFDGKAVHLGTEVHDPAG
jgi:predicted RNase H-like nuclease (RuvC/YqgF family)